MSNIFIDSNIWIYALVEAAQDKSRRKKALALLKKVHRENTLIVSAQVINEFHWILQKKYAVADDAVVSIVENTILKIADPRPLDMHTYRTAFTLRSDYSFSFWDSLIAASALQHSCSILYSEDMQHRQKIAGSMTILNPFQAVR